MRPLDTLRVLLGFTVLVILHFTVRPLLGWRVAPDFLIIALLLVAIRVRPGTAALVGFAMGIVYDSIALHAFGATALAMSAVGFAGSWMKAVFFADDLPLDAFFFFLGKWAFDLLYLIASRDGTLGELLKQALIWSPLSAAVTALTGLLALLVLRPLLRPAPA